MLLHSGLHLFQALRSVDAADARQRMSATASTRAVMTDFPAPATYGERAARMGDGKKRGTDSETANSEGLRGISCSYAMTYLTLQMCCMSVPVVV